MPFVAASSKAAFSRDSLTKRGFFFFMYAFFALVAFILEVSFIPRNRTGLYEHVTQRKRLLRRYHMVSSPKSRSTAVSVLFSGIHYHQPLGDESWPEEDRSRRRLSLTQT